jgi:hypothetical protein
MVKGLNGTNYSKTRKKGAKYLWTRWVKVNKFKSNETSNETRLITELWDNTTEMAFGWKNTSNTTEKPAQAGVIEPGVLPFARITKMSFNLGDKTKSGGWEIIAHKTETWLNQTN